MGRKKKNVERASVEATDFILEAIRQYPKMKEGWKNFEENRGFLLKHCQINLEAFVPEAAPNEDLFIQPGIRGKDRKLIDAYLDDKEKVYLLEHGIMGLEGEVKEVAEALFLKQLPRVEVERKFSLSQSTITRRRNEAVRLLAIEVDSFMIWKSEILFA